MEYQNTDCVFGGRKTVRLRVGPYFKKRSRISAMKKWFWLIVLLAGVVLPVHAQESIPISSPEDLAAIAENPDGDYILMEDLDMSGIDWIGPDFSGTLDGNGHSILNLTIADTGVSTAVTMDGNQKCYDSVFAGLFGKLENAQIRNLNLCNVRGVITTDQPCFLGAIAGYSMDSSVVNCSVSGELELRAHDRMFGVSGVLGYGVGSVENCLVDMTLICVDTDSGTRDEQFLGGVFGMGFMTVSDSEIRLDAYISEHGYVHSGGIAGMMMQYPVAMDKASRILRNDVDAKITFFEDNTDRRAYCKPIVGELLLNFNYGILNNQHKLEKHELKEYDRELRPEGCENPIYSETVIPSFCDTFGYTEYCCEGCGYTYTDHYTLHSHEVKNWIVKTASTTEHTGESTGVCVRCGVEVTREDPVLPPEPETVPTAPPETKPSIPETVSETSSQTKGVKTGTVLLIVCLIVLAASGGFASLILPHRSGGKHQKKRSQK